MDENQHRMAAISTKLRVQGHRVTPQRMAIMKNLIGNKQHPSVDQIYACVKKDFPMTSLATVYKTVHLLTQMGEITELGFGEDFKRYDGGNIHPHPHLICTRCRNIMDLDADQLTGLSQEVAKKTGYRIERHRLDFFGICPQCQQDALMQPANQSIYKEVKNV